MEKTPICHPKIQRSGSDTEQPKPTEHLSIAHGTEQCHFRGLQHCPTATAGIHPAPKLGTAKKPPPILPELTRPPNRAASSTTTALGGEAMEESKPKADHGASK